MSNRDQQLADLVQDRVAEFTGVSKATINSGDRSQVAVDARQLSVHFVREKTSLRLVQIAKLHTKASHVPIIWSLKQVKSRLQVDRKYKARVGELSAKMADLDTALAARMAQLEAQPEPAPEQVSADA